MEGLSELEIRADEAPSKLFDHVVDEALNGKQFAVDVWWDRFVDEETPPVPHVTIDGRPAMAFAHQVVDYVSTDNEYCSLVAEKFEEKMAMMWDDTMRYYGELNELNLWADWVSGFDGSKYREEAKANFSAQGIEKPIVDDLNEAAKTLALLAVKQWSDAVEAKDIAER